MDLFPIFQNLYPEGSRGGQCGVFAHRLIDFPLVGNFLASKINAVNKFGMRAANIGKDFLPGDVLITRESRVWGHVAVINKVIYQENTDIPLFIQLTESNFNLDLRVHHTRVLSATSTVIVGIIRGNFLFSV